MSKPKYPIAPEVKKQILERVKEGIPVKQLAAEHGISPQSIYAWLGKGATAPPTFLELGKLRQENRQLRELLGELTLTLAVEKKKHAR
jgi:transposase-like protein